MSSGSDCRQPTPCRCRQLGADARKGLTHKVGIPIALSVRLRRFRAFPENGPAGEDGMSGTRRFETEAEATEAANRQTLSLAGLAVTLAVLVMCVFLVKQLAHTTQVEDCLMASRLNCDKIAAAVH
jgi:hypothetical protein